MQTHILLQHWTQHIQQHRIVVQLHVVVAVVVLVVLVHLYHQQQLLSQQLHELHSQPLGVVMLQESPGQQILPTRNIFQSRELLDQAHHRCPWKGVQN
jgi:hypothetical protein